MAPSAALGSHGVIELLLPKAAPVAEAFGPGRSGMSLSLCLDGVANMRMQTVLPKTSLRSRIVTTVPSILSVRKQRNPQGQVLE